MEVHNDEEQKAMPEKRICPVCNKPPREGEEMRPIRIQEPEDVAAFNLNTPNKGPGLYQACEECIAKFRVMLGRRLMVEPATIRDGQMQ